MRIWNLLVFSWGTSEALKRRDEGVRLTYNLEHEEQVRNTSPESYEKAFGEIEVDNPPFVHDIFH
jgi:hypothetical protein